MNKGIIFLDTCVFIDCLESHRYNQIITHAVNSGYPITTSITVLGETITQLMEFGTDIDRIIKFKENLDEWGVSFFFPNDVVRILCYYIGDELTTRDVLYHQITDRTHLAYSIAYKADIFITSDGALQEFELPKKITDRGFYKPVTLPLIEFKRQFLLKKH